MGTRRICLTVFLALAGLASAQQYAHDQPKLEGVVINSLTGEPLPRVLVQVAGRATLTGPEGEFSFSFDGRGTASVQLTKPGYFAPGAKTRFSSASSSVAFGPDARKIILKLAPEAVITGRVTGQDDEPLEGAAIQVRAYMSQDDGPQQLLVVSTSRSDENGNFRIAELPAGRYYVTVSSAGINRNVLGAQTGQINLAYPLLVYYPGNEELAAATMVDLAPGQRMEVPFSLALRPAYKVSGTVVTQDLELDLVIV